MFLKNLLAYQQLTLMRLIKAPTSLDQRHLAFSAFAALRQWSLMVQSMLQNSDLPGCPSTPAAILQIMKNLNMHGVHHRRSFGMAIMHGVSESACAAFAF